MAHEVSAITNGDYAEHCTEYCLHRLHRRLARGLAVGMVVGQIGAGHSFDEVLADYPYLERGDIMQALRYAAWRSEEREVMLASS